MSLLTLAIRRTTPMLARASRPQARWAHGSHFDPFAIDPNNKKQMFAYYTAIIGALAAPIFAVRYQLNKYKYDKRHFG